MANDVCIQMLLQPRLAEQSWQRSARRLTSTSRIRRLGLATARCWARRGRRGSLSPTICGS
eukprot:4548253-Prymnesium_polylepis.1